MSIFSKFFSSKPKNYDKYGDVLKKQLTTKDQRQEVIDALKNIPAEQSVPQLLKRFELSVDSGIQDSREKDQCANLIIQHAEKSKAFVKEIIETKRRISWPIKIAEKIFSHEEYVELLLKNLTPNIPIFDDDSLERNEEILLALKELSIKSDAVVDKVSQFLLSRDENIRMAALECLEGLAQNNTTAKDTLLNFSKEPLTDENTRFLGVVHSIIQKHQWT